MRPNKLSALSVSYSIPSAIDATVRRVAATMNVPLSSVVTVALEQYFAKHNVAVAALPATDTRTGDLFSPASNPVLAENLARKAVEQ